MRPATRERERTRKVDRQTNRQTQRKKHRKGERQTQRALLNMESRLAIIKARAYILFNFLNV